VKIADFGIATNTTRNTTTILGQQMATTVYASPEFLQNEKPTFPSDIFSFSIIM
jgi:serine/threonine protein kinase